MKGLGNIKATGNCSLSLIATTKGLCNQEDAKSCKKIPKNMLVNFIPSIICEQANTRTTGDKPERDGDKPRDNKARIT